MLSMDYVKEWAARPFNPDMGILGWVALFVLFLATAYGWASVVKLIEGE